MLYKKFKSEHPKINKMIHEVIYWLLFDNKPHKPWPKWIDIDDSFYNKNHINQISFINHSTVLISFDNMHIITDPVFSEKIGPFKNIKFLTYKRIHKPGITLENVPKINFVLISHNHYDHLDKDSVLDIWNRDMNVFIVPKGVSKTLISWGIKKDYILELGRGESYEGDGLKICAETAVHWSGRNIFDFNYSHWLSFVVEHSNKKVFFAGDTGYGDHFYEIGEKYKNIDFSLIPIGSYEPRWMMKEQHIDPFEAIQAMKDLNSKKAMAIHFGTFKLSKEAHDKPVQDLISLLKKESPEIRNNFVIPDLFNSKKIYEI